MAWLPLWEGDRVIGAVQAAMLGMIRSSESRYLYDTFTSASQVNLNTHAPEVGGPWIANASSGYTTNIINKTDGTICFATGVSSNIIELPSVNFYAKIMVKFTPFTGGVGILTNFAPGSIYGYGDLTWCGSSTYLAYYPLAGNIGTIVNYSTMINNAYYLWEVQSYSGVLRCRYNGGVTRFSRNVLYPNNKYFGFFMNTSNLNAITSVEVFPTLGTDIPAP
jgi:hypothetical protein